MIPSQWAFIRGARGALLITSSSSASKTASNAAPYLPSRSRCRNRRESMRMPRSAARFRACCTVHSRVGSAMTPVRCRRLVPCSRNASAYSLLPSAVSRWKKSAAMTPSAWAVRNSRQVGPERRGVPDMVLEWPGRPRTPRRFIYPRTTSNQRELEDDLQRLPRADRPVLLALGQLPPARQQTDLSPLPGNSTALLLDASALGALQSADDSPGIPHLVSRSVLEGGRGTCLRPRHRRPRRCRDPRPTSGGRRASPPPARRRPRRATDLAGPPGGSGRCRTCRSRIRRSTRSPESSPGHSRSSRHGARYECPPRAAPVSRGAARGRASRSGRVRRGGRRSSRRRSG
jgi:hypothetical protein